MQSWNEESLIQHIAEQFPIKAPLVGIGDDCAVIPGEGSWLVTTDALVEGVHFIRDQIPPKDLGYKTVAVSVSDIAAKGGAPKYAFLSIALPKTVERSWIYSVIQGIKEACESWDIHLLGGDTVGSKRDIFLNLILMGSAPKTKTKYRHLAKPTDVICVTGNLGDSGGGLKALQEKTKNAEPLIHAHFHPTPHLKEGQWLTEQEGVHSMMDISDGLDCDLRRMLKSSHVGALVETTRIPLSPSLIHISTENQWDPLELALTGGEDYCLLLTVSADDFPKIRQQYQQHFGVALFDIGRIADPSGKLIYQKNGKPLELHYQNYDHFQ